MKLSRLKLSKKTKKSKKINIKRLMQANIGVSVLLAAQAVALAFLADFSKGQVPISTSFLTKDQLQTATTGNNVFASASHHLFDVRLANIVIAFLVVGAIYHLWVSWRARKTYEAELDKGFNKTRWVANCLSGSLVVISVGLLVGIYDYLTLLAIVVFTILASLLVMVSEINRQGSAVISRFCGSMAILAGLLPWIIIGLYIWGSIAYGSGLPVFVYWAAGSVALLSVATGAVSYLVLSGKKQWERYELAEYKYIALGFIIKTALAWQIFAGLLRK